MSALRKFILALLRGSRDREVWPVALLVLAVLVPAVSLVWFMNAAMRNERMAAREKWAEIFRPQLLSIQQGLEEYWRDQAAQLEELARTNPPAVAFAKVIETGLADSVILFDSAGKVAYPNTAVATPTE